MYRYGDTAPCYSSAKMLEDNLNESLRCEAFKDWTYSIDDVDGSAVIRHHGITLSQDSDKNVEKQKYTINIKNKLPYPQK